jgi:hypothetical protein
MRQDRARRRERVIAELLGSGLEEDARLVHLERRQRIVALPGRLERITAIDLLPLQVSGLTGHADLVLGLVVERLELGVAHRPVGDGGVLRNGGQPVALDRV